MSEKGKRLHLQLFLPRSQPGLTDALEKELQIPPGQRLHIHLLLISQCKFSMVQCVCPSHTSAVQVLRLSSVVQYMKQQCIIYRPLLLHPPHCTCCFRYFLLFLNVCMCLAKELSCEFHCTSSTMTINILILVLTWCSNVFRGINVRC